ncbi:MAG: DUF3048 domain-containing protein [Oscillospiraceae bacterium]
MAAVLLALLLAGCGTGTSVSSSAPPQSAPSQAASQPVAEEGISLQDMNINMLTGLARPEGMQQGQRPVAVMVANNRRALPQRGVAAADVVYEMVTEGGITRLMAMYADYSTLPQVGPVRSGRDQFLQFAIASAAIPVQIGASVYANNLSSLLGYKVVDGIRLGTTAFYFDESIAEPRPGGKLHEYCWVTDAGLLWSGMTYLDVYTTGEVAPLFWFADAAAAQKQEAYTISLTFSDAMGATFAYNAETGLYEKSIVYKTGEAEEIPHADEDGTRLAYTNVLALTDTVGLKPDGQCADFELEEGAGYYFTAGGVQQVTWKKGGPEQPLLLYGADGEMVQVQRGKTYIGILSEDIADGIVYAPQQAAG